MGERDTPFLEGHLSPDVIEKTSEICENDLRQFISGRSPGSLEGFVGGALTASTKGDIMNYSLGEANVGHLRSQCLVQGCDIEVDYLVVQMPHEEAKIIAPPHSYIALQGCKRLREHNKKYYPKLANDNEEN